MAQNGDRKITKNTKSASRRKAGLGRGLSSLLGENWSWDTEESEKNSLRELSVDQISPLPEQPRKRFTEEHLQELAQSIKSYGVLQPVLVVDQGDSHIPHRYRLVVGERRLRACKIAGKSSIPAQVIQADEQKQYEISLIENLVREDLAIDEQAQCFQQLMNRYGWSQSDLAEKIGKDRTYITRVLKVLQFGKDVQKMVLDGQLTVGHLRCIPTESPEIDANRLARKAATLALSVRQTQELVTQQKEKSSQKGAGKAEQGKAQAHNGHGNQNKGNQNKHEQPEKLTTGLFHQAAKCWPGVRFDTTSAKSDSESHTLTLQSQNPEALESLLRHLCKR